MRKRRGRPGWLLTIHWRKQRITKTLRTRRQAEATAARIEQVLADADLASIESETELRDLLRETAPVTAPKRPDVPTLGEYSTQWLEDKRDGWAQGTYAIREIIVRRHLRPDWKDVRLDDIDQPMVRTLLREKKAAGKSGSTLRGMLATIGGIYKSAMKDYPSIAANPAHGAGDDIVPSHRSGEKPKAWDIEQRERLVQHIEREHDPNVRELLLFLDATGVRVGEAQALTWSCIDTDRGEATIEQTYTRRVLDAPKTRTSSRDVIVPEATLARLLALRSTNNQAALAAGVEVSDVVFQGDGRLGRVMEWHHRNALKLACRRAGVPTMTVHSLRHTYATRMLGSGVPSDVVKVQLGHSSIRVTHDLYAHALKGDLPNRRKWLDQATDATLARPAQDAKS